MPSDPCRCAWASQTGGFKAGRRAGAAARASPARVIESSAPPGPDAVDARGQHRGEAALIEAAGSISMLIFRTGSKAELAVQSASKAADLLRG